MQLSRLDSRTRWILLAFALCVGTLFFIVNRPAYKGYFTDDDLDNIKNAIGIDWRDISRTLLVPSVVPKSYRATAYSYYLALTQLAGMRFPPYIAGIHAIHLLNVLLVWMLARALGAEYIGAGAAALFFAFHAATFGIYWKPMYVFDLICGTFVLAALLAYVRGRVILSLAFFWLALKSKEIAITLPLVLVAYELWLGGRRWIRVVPFLGISLLIGVQALIGNTQRDDAYTFRFTLAALEESAKFYAYWLVQMPFVAGAVVIALSFVFRNQRVWFGVFTFLALLGTLLFLPGRLFAAYLYVPLIGLAVALSVARRVAWLCMFFLLWIPWNYLGFREQRRVEQPLAAQRRTWVDGLASLLRAHPEIDTIVVGTVPEQFALHGMEGALRDLVPHRPATVVWLGSDQAPTALQQPHVALSMWNFATRTVEFFPRGPDESYIRFDGLTPLWQLEQGWSFRDGVVNWAGARVTARLSRPRNATAFEVVSREGHSGGEQLPGGQMEVLLGGQRIGMLPLHAGSRHDLRIALPPGAEGSAEIEFRIVPAPRDATGPVKVGQPLLAFGFVSTTPENGILTR
jgi:hypothetical protein